MARIFVIGIVWVCFFCALSDKGQAATAESSLVPIITLLLNNTDLGPENTEARCSDSIDNDQDGFTDCNDWDCGATLVCNPGPENTEGKCSDSIDNDQDGYIDCDDWDCDATLVCNLGPEDTEAKCSDSIDNDGDGYIDCDDFDCGTTLACYP